MPTWPSTLPQNVRITGYSETQQNQVLRSQNDMGPPKQRRRYSAEIERFQAEITVDRTQYSTFKTHWNDELNGGAIPTDWKHPITEASASVRFASPYSITPLGRGGQYFVIKLDMEILP